MDFNWKKIMNCKKCNFQNEETAKFCRNCGAELRMIIAKPPTNTQKPKSNSVVWLLLVIALIVCAVLGVLLLEQSKNKNNVNNNVITSEQGVVINGIRWATRNVDSRGTFVSSPEENGLLFTWDEAQTACPRGWRLPTRRELESLLNTNSSWTTQNGTNGKLFGSGSHTIFLPAAGFHFPRLGHDGIGRSGDYWSSTRCSTPYSRAMGLRFSSTASSSVHSSGRELGFSIRCVAE